MRVMRWRGRYLQWTKDSKRFQSVCRRRWWDCWLIHRDSTLYVWSNAHKKRHIFFIYCLMPLLSICYGLFQMVKWWWLLQVPISPGKAGKVEMWLSSPTRKAAERSLVSLNRVGVKRVNPDQDMDLCGNGSELISTGVASGQSPFQTPPSLSYCHDKVILFS